MSQDYTLAQIAYEGYVETTGGVSIITGHKLPPFENLDERIKDAWYNAAKAVREEIFSDFDPPRED